MQDARIILYADDDPDDIFLLREALDECNFTFPVELVTVTNGFELLSTLHAWLEADHPPPDIILLDINMPVMDGLMTLENIRHDLHFRSLPTVIFSGSTNQQDVDLAHELGAEAYITKPHNADDLARVVAEIVDKWAREPDNPSREMGD